MAIRVNPKLIDELEHFGAEDVSMCYHCGDCSAVCPHADEVYVFPRKSMRSLQMGLERKLETGLEPWLCYYCGQCSEQCPREADPGETMMSVRRWLISRYDFTGIGRIFFKSKTSEIITIIVISIITAFGFVFNGITNGSIYLYDGEGAFIPSTLVHKFDLTLGAIIGLIILINAGRMWWMTMVVRKGLPIPLWLYIKYIYLLPWHFFTQRRYAECEPAQPRNIHMPWFIHLGLMLGYFIMLVMVMVFIEQLQFGPAIKWPFHIFGYLASIGLLLGTGYFIYNRKKKTHVQYKKTHSTDWVFVLLLFFIALTGVLQHIFHRIDLIIAANITYVVHLMFVVPWLLRMPFCKWMHMIYRPMALYFADIRVEALEIKTKQAEHKIQPGYTI